MNLKHFLTVTALVVSTLSTSMIPVWAVNPPLKTGMDVKEAQQIEVNGVKIENFTGRVIIKSTGTDKNVRVALNGPDDLLKQVIVSDNYGVDKGNLYIAFEKDVPVLKDVNTLILTLEMPAQMPLDLSLVGGKAEIGDRKTNDTKINLNGFGDVNLTSVWNLKSNIDGSGEITVRKVSGDVVMINIWGDGRYVFPQGSIGQLDASIQGTGVINVMAEVKDAKLKSEGAGTMNLNTVTGKLSQSMSGAGTINIMKIAGSIKNNVSGSGQLEMNCRKDSQK